MNKILFFMLSVIALISFSAVSYSEEDFSFRNSQFEATSIDYYIENYKAAVANSWATLDDSDDPYAFSLLKSWVEEILKEADKAQKNNFFSPDRFSYLQRNTSVQEIGERYYLCEVIDISMASFTTGFIDKAFDRLKEQIDNKEIYSQSAKLRIESALLFAKEIKNIISDVRNEMFSISQNFENTKDIAYCGLSILDLDEILSNISMKINSLNELAKSCDGLDKNPASSRWSGSPK